jgi:hypothetical protein
MQKAVETVRAISARPAAAGTIGNQISAVCLVTNSQFPITSYHTATPKDGMSLVDMVDCRKGSPGLLMSDVTLQVPGTIIAVPKAGRNQPCPCGSGKKYKFCHARAG